MPLHSKEAEGGGGNALIFLTVSTSCAKNFWGSQSWRPYRGTKSAKMPNKCDILKDELENITQVDKPSSVFPEKVTIGLGKLATISLQRTMGVTTGIN